MGHSHIDECLNRLGILCLWNNQNAVDDLSGLMYPIFISGFFVVPFKDMMQKCLFWFAGLHNCPRTKLIALSNSGKFLANILRLNASHAASWLVLVNHP